MAFFSAEVVPAQSPVETPWSPWTVNSSSSRGIGYIGLVGDPLVGTESWQAIACYHPALMWVQVAEMCRPKGKSKRKWEWW